MKRTTQTNVKTTEEDFDFLRKAVAERWPDALVTNSGVVLALVKIAARETLGLKKTQPKAPRDIARPITLG